MIAAGILLYMQQNPPQDHTDTFIAINNRLDAIDARLDNLEQPIYIGTKSYDGAVTMPLTPVYQGKGMYIISEPPSLLKQE